MELCSVRADRLSCRLGLGHSQRTDLGPTNRRPRSPAGFTPRPEQPRLRPLKSHATALESPPLCSKNDVEQGSWPRSCIAGHGQVGHEDGCHREPLPRLARWRRWHMGMTHDSWPCVCSAAALCPQCGRRRKGGTDPYLPQRRLDAQGSSNIIHCTVDESQHARCTPPHNQRSGAEGQQSHGWRVPRAPTWRACQPRLSAHARRVLEVSHTVAYALRPVAAQVPS